MAHNFLFCNAHNSATYSSETISLCCCSVTQSFLILHDPMDCSTPGLPVPHHFLEFVKIHAHCIGDAVQPSHALIPWFPSTLDLSQCQGLFQWAVYQIWWPKYWSFSFSISPSNAYSGLISLKIDWFDIPAVQGNLRSLLQHHSSKASILRHSTFFTVQLSKLYMTTGKKP